MPSLVSPDEALRRLTVRLRGAWSQVLVGEPWHCELKLSPQGLSGPALERAWSETFRTKVLWDEWPAHAVEGVRVVDRPAQHNRITHTLPGMLRIDTIDAAASLLGDEWTARLERGRRRYAVLSASFPDLPDPARLLREVDAWSDIDFDLACRCARWFTANPASGLTAREVPVEGIGTKWLSRRRAVVRTLAGLDDLGLVAGRPARVQVTYLDPTHLAAGGRRHDVATEGDADAVAYRPRVVVICENRDTAQRFPEVEDGIAVEGNEVSRSALAAFGWFRAAKRIIYWGDMDAAGLEILNGHRAADHRVESIFMDLAAYEAWERYGVDHDHDGKQIGPRPTKVLDHLQEGERQLYVALCSEGWTRHRRIEQERIPLTEAAALVRGARADAG